MRAASDEQGTVAPPQAGAFWVSISDEQQAVAVDSNWLVRIAESVLTGENVASAEISIALVDDATIHDVNRRFLRHDYPTDVISFRLDAPDPAALIERFGERRFPDFV